MCNKYIDTSASVPSLHHGVHKQIFYSFIALILLPEYSKC